MINFKIIIPGECAVKKNTVGELWFRWQTNKHTGAKIKIPLERPVKYYKPPYVNWAKNAVTSLAVFKNNLALHNNILNGEQLILPITEPIFLTCVFFLKHQRIVDVSNLIEAPQDLLAGNAGNFLDSVKTIDGQKTKIKYDHDKYKIIADDNRWIIKNLGGSTIFIDPIAPRTEIFISSFSFGKWGNMFREIHPGLELGNVDLEQPKLDFDSDPFGGIFK